MLGLSAASAGLAVSLVRDYADEVTAQVGPLVRVLIARRDIPRGKTLTPANGSRYAVERRVPESFVPPGAFRRPSDVMGLRALTRIPEGAYLGREHLATPTVRGARAGAFHPREGRVVEVPVAGATAVGDALRPGLRVDVLVTSERPPGPPRSYLALQRIELVDFRAPGETDTFSEAEARRADGVAALRVTLPQAVLLTAAQNFARELRLIPRPPADVRRLPSTAVSASDLHP
jgi:pilus assembly protein CpaB